MIHKEHYSQHFVFGGGEIIKFYFQLRRKITTDAIFVCDNFERNVGIVEEEERK